MRLFLVNCMLLASFAAALPNGREKRDFEFIKNLITTALFGRHEINIETSPDVEADTEYKLYELPGYDDVLIKVPVGEETTYPLNAPVNLDAFGSTVGTETADNTLAALNQVNKLVSSGILSEKQDHVLKNTIVPMVPALDTYEAAKDIKTAPVIEMRNPEHEKITPLEDKVKLETPSKPIYSYNAVHRNPEFEITGKKSVSSNCVEKKNDEIILTDVPHQVLTIQRGHLFKIPPLDTSYRRINTDEYIRYPFYPPTLTKIIGTPELLPQRLPIKHILRLPLQNDPINSPLLKHLQKPSHLDAVTENTSKANENTQTPEPIYDFDDRMGIPQTLGTTPLQFSPHPTKEEINEASTSEQPVEISSESPPPSSTFTTLKPSESKSENSIDITTENIPPANEEPSKGSNSELAIEKTKDISNVSEKQNVPIPIVLNNSFAALIGHHKFGERLKMNVKTNNGANVKIPNKYYNVTPVINIGDSHKQDSATDNSLHTNKVREPPTKLDKGSEISLNTNNLRENPWKPSKSSLKDKTTSAPHLYRYVYHQNNADGSSTSIRGGNTGVLVNVKAGNAKSRGDIPDD